MNVYQHDSSYSAKTSSFSSDDLYWGRKVLRRMPLPPSDAKTRIRVTVTPSIQDVNPAVIDTFVSDELLFNIAKETDFVLGLLPVGLTPGVYNVVLYYGGASSIGIARLYLSSLAGVSFSVTIEQWGKQLYPFE